MTIIIIILIAIMLLGFYVTNKSDQKLAERSTHEGSKRASGISKLRKENNFEITKRFDGNSYFSKGVYIDEKNKKIALIEGEKYAVYNIRDLLSSELLLDGNEVTRTSRTSQIGGALLGSVVAGGVGAIIGGLSASQTSENNISSIDVLIIVNDTNNPTFTINYFDKEYQEGSVYSPIPKHLLKKEIEEAEKLHRTLSVLIHQADEADKLKEPENEKQKQITSNTSIADEIRKLADLRDDGIISSEEFERQKRNLII